MSVTVVGPDGQQLEVDPEQARVLADRGFRVISADERATQAADEAREEFYSTPGQKISAGIAGAARGATFGLSDVVGRAMGAEEELSALREYNPGVSLATEIGGSLLTAKAPAGLATKVVGTAAEGAGVVARLGRAAGGAAVEGAIYGAGSGVSEVALSKDPVTIDRMVSTIGSHALFGGGVGGAVGLATKGIGIGLSKAKGALDDAARVASVSDDLARLDMKGLRAAEKTELEAIEAARVPKRQELADEVAALRRDVKEQKHFLTTKDVELPAVEGKLSPTELGKKFVKAQKQLDHLLDNPKGFSANPEKAIDALQRQEEAMKRLLDRSDELRTVFKADKTPARLAALDSVAPALERNRALQEKLAGLKAPAASPRLAEIANAKDVLAAGGGKKSLVEDMLGGSIMGHVAGAVSGLPIVGPMIGAKVARLATDVVFGKMGNAAAATAARASKAIGTLLDVGSKVAPAAPVLATKVLSAVRYASGDADEPTKDAKPKKVKLADAYKARSAELRSQTAYDPSGAPVMRVEARAKVAERLSGIRAVDPVLADRMETAAARRIEFLASKLPRRPDLAPQIGPDLWQPSDMEMRTFARYAAAVEDPHAITERLADGSLTAEDAEAMKTVYPDLYGDIVQQISEQLPTLRETLPFSRRISLSIFTGMPVDASMDPRVIAALQGAFADEPGTDGGTHAPQPQPQFGSVKAEQSTPAQERMQ